MLKSQTYIALFLMTAACASVDVDVPAQDASTRAGGKTDEFPDAHTSDVDFADYSTTADSNSSQELETQAGDAGALIEDADSDQETVEDPFAPAHNINLHLVTFPEDLEAPAYDYPRVDSGFFLSGTEFWQKWSGGENPTYSYSDGSDFGRRCMYASALRFKALMEEPPESIVKLRNESKWSGSFFNWNDDYGNDASWGDGSSARLWAWRTTLIKWISQTNQDGSCYLPTLDMLELLATDCQENAEFSEGEIQGCRAP